jgi:N-acetylmuramoyl-L-alanine amidase
MTIAPIWHPDSALVDTLYPSPNIEPRRADLVPSILLLHYTGLETAARAIEILSRTDCKVSCHYVVDVDGRITQMVAEETRAWHAGVSSWTGETDVNSASIGIEIQNLGHVGGCPPYPPAQMAAVRDLGRDILARHPAITPARVLAHSDVAPGRKIDPGEWFDWAWLARHGVGLWVEPAPLDPADRGIGPDAGAASAADRVAMTETPAAAQSPASSAVTAAILRMQTLLATFGYAIAATGLFDTPTETAIKAFQRHWRPARVDGRLDASTLATAEKLVAASGAREFPIA